MWPHVEAMLTAAVRRTRLASASDLLISVLSGKATLWVAEEDWKICGAAVTDVYDTGYGVVCNVNAIGGTELDDWYHLIGVIDDYARANGCTSMRLMGRKGWQRKLAKRDFKVTGVIMERKL